MLLEAECPSGRRELQEGRCMRRALVDQHWQLWRRTCKYLGAFADIECGDMAVV
jgi:hypothetical protein